MSVVQTEQRGQDHFFRLQKQDLRHTKLFHKTLCYSKVNNHVRASSLDYNIK